MKQKSTQKPLELEVLNSIKQTYIVRFAFNESIQEENSYWEFEEIIFKHKPSLEEIKTLITDYYNKCCDKEILSGFVYNNLPVWLSQENQLNYKSAFDLAKQTNSSNLPVKFKFGTDIEPQYFVFETLEKLEDFYIKMNQFIHSTLEKNWNLKDDINWEQYII